MDVLGQLNMRAFLKQSFHLLCHYDFVQIVSYIHIWMKFINSPNKFQSINVKQKLQCNISIYKVNADNAGNMDTSLKVIIKLFNNVESKFKV